MGGGGGGDGGGERDRGRVVGWGRPERDLSCCALQRLWLICEGWQVYVDVGVWVGRGLEEGRGYSLVTKETPARRCDDSVCRCVFLQPYLVCFGLFVTLM